MAESYWHLKNCFLFEHLALQDINQLEASSRFRHLKKGEPVYLPADAADGVILLTSGRINICHLTPEGKQSILVLIEPGELFGELSLLDSSSRDEYAEAVVASQVVLIPKTEMQMLMNRYPNLAMGVTRLIGSRRQRIERRLRNLLFRSNRERLVHLLIELMEQFGESSTQGQRIRIKLTHQEMANIIGSTRETVTVVLGQLQNEGLIRVIRRQIYVEDLSRLHKEVNEVARAMPSHEPKPRQNKAFQQLQPRCT